MLNNRKTGQKLRVLRGEKSIASVASEIGISASSVQAYEVGQRRPRDEVKVKLAKYYHTCVEELFYDHEVT